MATAKLRPMLKQQLRLAAPLCVSQIGLQLMSVVDAAMLGRFSDAALAGAGVATGLYFALTVFGIGAVMGLDTLLPQALGAGEEANARMLLSRGIRVALAIGAAITLLLLPALELLRLVDVAPAVLDEARVYLYARAPGVVPILVFTSQRSYLQSRGITRPMVLAMVVANAINVVANYVLIFGHGGIAGLTVPAMGSAGAGLSSTLVSWSAVVVGAWAIARTSTGPGPAHGSSSHLTRKILKLGVPVGLQLAAEVGIFALTGMLAGRLGTVPAAAHNSALTLASFSFAIAMGLGASTSVLVGRAVGMNDQQAIRRAGIAGVGLAAAIMGSMGLIFMLIPERLAGIFTNSPVVIAAAVPLIRIAAVFQLSDASQAVLGGALRGIGDTRVAFVANVVGHYGIGLPIALTLAFVMGIGAPGLWWGLSAGLTSVALFLGARFWHRSSQFIARS